MDFEQRHSSPDLYQEQEHDDCGMEIEFYDQKAQYSSALPSTWDSQHEKSTADKTDLTSSTYEESKLEVEGEVCDYDSVQEEDAPSFRVEDGNETHIPIPDFSQPAKLGKEGKDLWILIIQPFIQQYLNNIQNDESLQNLAREVKKYRAKSNRVKSQKKLVDLILDVKGTDDLSLIDFLSSLHEFFLEEKDYQAVKNSISDKKDIYMSLLPAFRVKVEEAVKKAEVSEFYTLFGQIRDCCQ